MKEEKKLTWNELYKLAMENYENGGDGIVECWEEKDYLESGLMTKEEALKNFAIRKSIYDDMAGWF